MRNFRDRVAGVTGGSRGIGRATALALARAGAHVVLGGRDAEALEGVAGEIRALGREVLWVQGDVTLAGDAGGFVGAGLERFGRIDILVACAGRYFRKPAADTSLEDIDASMAVNFYGALRVVRCVLPSMLERKSGHVVLVTSVDARKGIPPDGAYVAAKAALSGFAGVLRQELRGTGVDVTNVLPGRVDTAMLEDLRVPRISAKIPAEAVARAILKGIRWRRAEVIVPFPARVLLWLDALSPRLGDWLVRTLGLSGTEVRTRESGSRSSGT